MAAKSGKNGLLSVNGTSAISSVRNWRIDPKNAVVGGAASNSGGARFNLPGVSDFSGSFQLYGPSTLGIVVPGTAYVFYGQPDSTGDEVKGGIIIDSMTVNCDVEGGGILSADVAFSSIGSSSAVYTADNVALEYKTRTALTNTGVPAIQSSIGCGATWEVLGQVETEIDNVRNWSLTLTSANVAFSHSGAGGVTKRVAGEKSAKASVQFYNADVGIYDAATTDYRAGTVGKLRLYTDDTLYWLLTYGVISASPFEVPIEGAGMVANELQIDWSSHARVSGTVTRGALTDPNAVSWFS